MIEQQFAGDNAPLRLTGKINVPFTLRPDDLRELEGLVSELLDIPKNIVRCNIHYRVHYDTSADSSAEENIGNLDELLSSTNTSDSYLKQITLDGISSSIDTSGNLPNIRIHLIRGTCSIRYEVEGKSKTWVLIVQREIKDFIEKRSGIFLRFMHWFCRKNFVMDCCLSVFLGAITCASLIYLLHPDINRKATFMLFAGASLFWFLSLTFSGIFKRYGAPENYTDHIRLQFFLWGEYRERLRRRMSYLSGFILLLLGAIIGVPVTEAWTHFRPLVLGGK